MAFVLEAWHGIPHGHAGIETTVQHMRRVAREAQASPLLRDTADRILREAGNDLEAAHLLRGWLDSHTAFEFDPPGVERIKTPRAMLEEIRDRRVARGDCDDVAVLGAALSHMMGLPSRFQLVGFQYGEPYGHVYTEVRAGRRWVDLDTTRPAQLPPGLKIRRRGQRRT